MYQPSLTVDLTSPLENFSLPNEDEGAADGFAAKTQFEALNQHIRVPDVDNVPS